MTLVHKFFTIFIITLCLVFTNNINTNILTDFNFEISKNFNIYKVYLTVKNDLIYFSNNDDINAVNNENYYDLIFINDNDEIEVIYSNNIVTPLIDSQVIKEWQEMK